MMKKLTLTLVFGVILLLGHAQTASTSDYLVAQPIADRLVPFDLTDPGISKAIEFGADLAWASEQNFRRVMLFSGPGQVDVVRASFQPTYPLVNDTDLTQEQLDDLNWRLYLIDTYAGPNTNLTLNCDHPNVDSYYVGQPAHWEQLIQTTAQAFIDGGHNVITVGAFNEPDYSVTGQGTIDDMYNITNLMNNNPFFNNIRLGGGNVLNCDEAQYWYDYLVPAGVDEGNTHQLAGSFDSFASFLQNVRSNGHHATLDEMHNVGEALVGYEYGMQTGIWWGPAELARGEIAKATDGQRIGYAEHRPNWTSAAVYRALDGKIQAFGGTSERQAVTTTYNYVSKDRAVYYDGHGPQREFVLELPGGTGYWTGQTNAERVINITWGEDIQPAIDGRYILVNRNSSLVMGVEGSTTAEGSNIAQLSYTGSSNQQWDVYPVDTRIGGDFSYYRIRPASNSAMMLDLNDYSLDNGANLHQWTTGNGGNQQWYLDYAGDGWFYIRSRESSKCIDVYNGGTASGANVVQWEKNGGVNQQWRFIPVGAPIEFNAPSAPGSLSATAQPASIRLDWTASPESDVAGYTVLRAEAASGPFNTIARNVAATTFVDNTTIAGVQYYYQVRAEDNSVNRSGNSNQVSASVTGQNSLVAQYGFNNLTSDASVNSNNASTYGSISYSSAIDGTGIVLNGSDAFVQLPSDVANHESITIASWVYWNGGGSWQRIFDFGTGTDEYLFLSPSSGNGQLHFGIKNGGGEQVLTSTSLSTGTWTHVAVTLAPSSAVLYVNGQQAASSSSITIDPRDFNPVMNYIGRSQWPDPLLNGVVDDFRIYNYALSAGEVASLAGNQGAILSGYYQLQNRATDHYLDGMGRTTNGDDCGQWANTSSYNSHWDMLHIEGSYYQLQNRATGLLLDGMGRTANGDACGQYANTAHVNSHWELINIEGDFYQLQNRGTGLFLDNLGANTNGATVAQWANTTSYNSQWQLVSQTGTRSDSQLDSQLNDSELLFAVYPNPSHDFLLFTTAILDYEGMQWTIQDMSGRLLMNGNGDAGKVDIRGLSSGTYLLSIETASESHMVRFVKE